MTALLSDTRLQGLLLFIVAFLLYANTLGHGFVMGDRAVITENQWTQQGVSGMPKLLSADSFAGFLTDDNAKTLLNGGRYQPLSLVFFAVLVQFFGNNSFVFHLFTVLLYASCCLLLYRFLLKALKTERYQGIATSVAFVTTALFATHPVHTEVVANVKSCDELLAFLAGIGALFSLLNALESRGHRWNIAAGLLFLLACLARESVIPLLAVAPMALWFFRDTKPLEALRRAWPLLGALILYVLAQGWALDWQFSGQVMHDPLGNPFLKADVDQWVPFSAGEKAATILYTLVEYLRLLVWPWPLTHDYNPFQIEVQTFSQPAVIISIVLHVLLAGLAFWGLYRKKLYAFGLVFYAVTLSIVANIIIPMGVFMAERFLFTPSLGFCLAIAALVMPLLQRSKLLRITGISAVTALIVVWCTITLLRSPAWKSEERLFETDIVTSPNSAKLRNMIGTALLTKALNTSDPSERQSLLQQADQNLRRAVELHPTYYDAFLAYGACTFYLQKYDLAIQSYRGATRINPQDPKARLGLAYALRYGGDYVAKFGNEPEKAIAYLSEAWQLNADTATATHLAQQYRILKEPQEAARWLERALSLAPNDPRLTALLNEITAKMPAKTSDEHQQSSPFMPGSGGN